MFNLSPNCPVLFLNLSKNSVFPCLSSARLGRHLVTGLRNSVLTGFLASIIFYKQILILLLLGGDPLGHVSDPSLPLSLLVDFFATRLCVL